jgi:hypothetical protein
LALVLITPIIQTLVGVDFSPSMVEPPDSNLDSIGMSVCLIEEGTNGCFVDPVVLVASSV